MLLNKTRIFVPEGRLLMGVIDEYDVLEPNQVYICVSSPPYVLKIQSKICLLKFKVAVFYSVLPLKNVQTENITGFENFFFASINQK